jgi:hypothetical protein
VASVVDEPPFGVASSYGSHLGPVSKLIGGWQFSSIVTFVDPLPTLARSAIV